MSLNLTGNKAGIDACFALSTTYLKEQWQAMRGPHVDCMIAVGNSEMRSNAVMAQKREETTKEKDS